jgi:hypothetical protein
MGVLLALLLLCTPLAQAALQPRVTISVRHLPQRPLELDVGASHTFEIQVESDQPFRMAVAMTDAYYPGRGVFWSGGDRAVRGTSATLYLTVTGKNSTADLWPVCDWPDAGTCWPGGVAPLAIVAGVRLQDGSLVSQVFPFAVVVP